jgi:hypothetical protein
LRLDEHLGISEVLVLITDYWEPEDALVLPEEPLVLVELLVLLGLFVLEESEELDELDDFLPPLPRQYPLTWAPSFRV